MKIVLKKNLKKKAFSLVELVLAMGLSIISLVAMIKVSVETTKQSIKNDSADTATQIASATTDTLVKLRDIDPARGIIPDIYKTCTSPVGYSGYQESAFTGGDVYLSKNTSTSILSLTTSQPSTSTNGPFTTVSKSVPQINNAPTLTFGRDNVLDPAGTNIYYRSISLQYNSQYKVVIARIVIYWTLYNTDYFYVTYPSFSLSSLC